jgi:hypothetical protein
MEIKFQHKRQITVNCRKDSTRKNKIENAFKHKADGKQFLREHCVTPIIQ